MFVGVSFGSSRLFQHIFDEHEPNTIETDVLLKTSVETNDETTDSEDDFMSCCASETTDSDDDYMSCCDFGEFCQEDHGTSGYMEWKYMKGGQVQVNVIGNAGVTGHLWTLVLG